MDVGPAVEQARFAYLVKEIVHLELLLIERPLFSKDYSFVSKLAELYSKLRDKSLKPKLAQKIIDSLVDADAERLLVMRVEYVEKWKEAIERLAAAICHEMPTTIEDIQMAIRGYGVTEGNWLDYLACFTKVTANPKEVFHPCFAIEYNGVIWYIMPNKNWLIHGKQVPPALEHIGPLEGHNFLNDEEVKKWQ